MDLIAQIDSADSHYFKKELLEFQYIYSIFKKMLQIH